MEPYLRQAIVVSDCPEVRNIELPLLHRIEAVAFFRTCGGGDTLHGCIQQQQNSANASFSMISETSIYL